jgi:hypothetical protein
MFSIVMILLDTDIPYSSNAQEKILLIN